MIQISRASLVASSKAFALREAIIAALKEYFSDIEVRAHIGKLDIGDVIEKAVFNPPTIAVAATRMTSDSRLSGADDLIVQLTAYVVTEDLMVSGRRVNRDELAIAICEAILVLLSDPEVPHWVDGVGPPDDIVSQPLFTMANFQKGVVYYAVTWRQTLYAISDANFFTGDAP